MYDEEELRRMSPQERMALRRALAALDGHEVKVSKAGERRRAIFLIVIIGCCLGLAAWTGVLATTLPRFYRAGGWRGAWVGFDLALLGAFAATGWASFRRRQILIICLVVLATLLCCDAWFDVVLDARTKGFFLSLTSALVIELPLAGLAIFGARRLLRVTNAVMRRYQGETGPLPRLRKIPIIGVAPGRPLSDMLAGPAEQLGDGITAEHADSGPGRKS